MLRIEKILSIQNTRQKIEIDLFIEWAGENFKRSETFMFLNQDTIEKVFSDRVPWKYFPIDVSPPFPASSIVLSDCFTFHMVLCNGISNWCAGRGGRWRVAGVDVGIRGPWTSRDGTLLDPPRAYFGCRSPGQFGKTCWPKIMPAAHHTRRPVVPK